MKHQLILVATLPASVFSFHLNGHSLSRRIVCPNRLEFQKLDHDFVLESNQNQNQEVQPVPRQRRRRREQQHQQRDETSIDQDSHRHSASDWVHNLKTWRNSSVLREIQNPVIVLSAWATAVSLVQKTLLATNTRWAANMCVPHSAHTFLVSSLGLLLVFRTNSAYQRFMEGRKIWEQILTVSRNLSRLVTLYRKEVGSERRARIQYLLAAFPYLLRHQVRSGCLCSEEPEHIERENRLLLQEPNGETCYVDRQALPWSLLSIAGESNLKHIAQVPNRPLWICDRLGQEIMGIPTDTNFSSRERLKLLGDVDKLANAIGACERIHQTAVPLHYARHSLRSLTVWILTLPFSLVKDFGLLTGPVTGLVSWLLFGVYQIGHSIEDPFQGSSLRLSTLCDDIRRDVLACEDVRYSAFYIEGENDVESSQHHIDLERNDIFPQPSTKSIPLANNPKLVLQNGEFEVIGLKTKV